MEDETSQPTSSPGSANSEFPEHQQSAIILMKAGGLLSMIACFFIMRDVVIKFNKGERIRLTHKIVCEMSLALFWASFFSPFMSTWMVPKDEGDYMSAGNTNSCSAQGFLESFFYGLSVSMNSILAFTYSMIVKLGRKDEARSKRDLFMILWLPPIFCFLLALKPLFDNAYNYTDFHVCGLAEWPLGGLHESYTDDYRYECLRGCNVLEFKIIRFVLIGLANLIIVVSVVFLIHHVISSERRMNNDSASASNNESSTNATWQGIFYIGAFLFSWAPWYIWQWIRITSGGLTMETVDSPALLYIISITHPLQGVGNAFVYFRPKYLKFRERDPNEFRLASVLRALDITDRLSILSTILSKEWWQTLMSNRDVSDGACCEPINSSGILV